MVYKAIGFDWGGVINGKPGNYFSIGMSKILSISAEKFLEVYFNHNKDFNRGSIDGNELWHRILSDLKCEHKSREVANFLADAKKIDINKKVIDLIDTLKMNGYKVGLLSNNTVEGGNEMRFHGIDRHFDVFHISAETGDVKPEPQSFLKFTSALGVEPSELVFIDDSSKSLESSSIVKFTPILYKNFDQCIESLIKLGVRI